MSVVVHGASALVRPGGLTWRERLATTAGTLVLALGLLVLIAWAWRVDALIAPSGCPCKPTRTWG
jgi:hypothetical protein